MFMKIFKNIKNNNDAESQRKVQERMDTLVRGMVSFMEQNKITVFELSDLLMHFLSKNLVSLTRIITEGMGKNDEAYKKISELNLVINQLENKINDYEQQEKIGGQENKE